jgi:ribosomal protein L11 methyltransferase
MLWWEVVLEVPPDQADALASAVLPLAYGGVAVEPSIESEPGSEAFSVATDRPAKVKAYLPVDAAFPGKREALLQAALEAQPGVKFNEQQLQESDWAEGWKSYFKPVRIGHLLLVRPPWSRARAGGRAVIVLEPGMAFGTGDHVTTRACLLAVERLLKPGGRVLDLGTGSGILAIAAAKLGASQVLAVDTDALAVAAAIENCRRNEVKSKVRIAQGSLELARTWRPDLLLANLTSALHAGLAASIAETVASGGWLFGAGIGEAGLPLALGAYRAAGAHGIRVGRRGAWRTIEWHKPS